LARRSPRQLAASERYGRIYLASRNLNKADAARSELEAGTGKAISEVALLDSVAALLASLREPIDDLSRAVSFTPAGRMRLPAR